MNFEVIAKNFEVSEELLKKFDHSLNRLKHSLKSFAHFEKRGSIIIEKRPRKAEFKAKIVFRLPKHTVATKDVGTSPEQALHKAAEDARDRVLKIKDLLKDVHDKFRRTKVSKQ